MKNSTIQRMIEKLEQAEEYPEFVRPNLAYVKECLKYESGVNRNMARHILNIKKINKEQENE